ncbi:LacI family DNA-binding transcriptional regulator [Desulfogranum japonicum]|uniref:LacI family DNA-binding transcriptional regulator n=1 Tax=Desulfogranum japonicum TaxID=231447 RepID=UPI000403C67C|nr:LacI family DNA-binding transcriptional regulator [Desulfogranum japonicum]
MAGRKKNITLGDIASLLGISKATVSLAINNDPRVAVKTRQNILRAVEELGYVYNRGAASLSTGHSLTVGIAVHDITNPYFAEVCTECEAVLRSANRLAFLSSTRESRDHQLRFIKALIEHRGDGLIMSPVDGTGMEDLQSIRINRLPTVLIARNIEGAELDFVGNDDVAAFRALTNHLISLGHTRIAMVGGGQQAMVSQNRREGFFQAMKEHGLSVDPALVLDVLTSPAGGEQAFAILQTTLKMPTAVIAFTDLIAFGLLSAMHRKGMVPGRDLAVVGCDDIDEAARGYVQLTTMRTCKGEIGKKAAELLLRRIRQPEAPVQQIRLHAELVIRQSCGARPIPL